MTKALLLEQKGQLTRLLASSLRPAQIDMETISTLAAFEQSLARKRPDVVLLDLTMPGISGMNVLKEVLAKHPDLPVLLLTAKGSKIDLLKFLRTFQTIDFVRSPIEPAEVLYRMLRLVEKSLQPSTSSKASAERPKLRHLVSELHNSHSGRIDAERISGLFCLPLAEVARLLEAKPSSVHKTPDASALQPKLALLERIAAGLLRLTGSPEGLRMWLNAPNPELNNLTPLTLLKDGKAEIVANLIEDALLGHPG